MATIVEYSLQERSFDAYPSRIVSPIEPSACCRTDMARIGGLEAEGDRSFYYRRCVSCGFTVRHFLPRYGDVALQYIPEVDDVSKLVSMASFHLSLE